MSLDLWMQLLALGGLGIGRLVGIAAEKGGVSKLLGFLRSSRSSRCS